MRRMKQYFSVFGHALLAHTSTRTRMPCVRGGALLLLPLVLLHSLLSQHAAVAYDLVRVCNPEGPLSAAFVDEVYARYPPTSHPEYGQACVRLAELQREMEEASNDCTIVGMCDVSVEKRKIKEATPACDALKAREADAAARLNAQIPFADAPFLPVVCMCLSHARTSSSS